MSNSNEQVVLKSRADGIPQPSNFEIVSVPIKSPQANEVLIRNLYLSVEPAMRGWVSAVGNYSEPVGIGEVMRSFATGVVEESGDSRYQVGDFVTGMFGWQRFATVSGDAIDRKIESDDPPLSTSLGILGLNGLTAYFGLLDCGEPEPGNTVVVSTAAGAVGSAVGQMAKIKGCRTVGITSTPAKIKQCRDDFGFDACINYNAETDLQQALANACPDGVDVYFDNTSGSISDAVMTQLNLNARVVICGTSSIASWDPIPQGPRVERHILVKRARMQGILIFDYADRYVEGRRSISGWIKAGKLNYAEDILQGIASAPDAIAGLYRGENQGKRLIQLE